MFDNKWFVDEKYRFILRRRSGMSRSLAADADLVIDTDGKVSKDRYGDVPRPSIFLERICAYVVCNKCYGFNYGNDTCKRCRGRGYTTIWKNLLTILRGEAKTSAPSP